MTECREEANTLFLERLKMSEISLSKKEEALLRALNTTNFSNSIHEDLSDLIQYVTPPDTPLFSRLRRTTASALTHEWTETTLTTTFSDSVYADGGAPVDTTNSTARRDNKVMSVGRIAKATELLNATNTIGKSSGMDAFAREVEEKMMDVMRAIEYWIWNGDKTQTAPQQMNGLIAELASGSNAVSNGASAAALVEAKLQEALIAAYAAGGNPNVILCRPAVAQRIAGFTADRVRYLAGGQAGGLGVSTMRYLSPLGFDLEIVPVRGDFLPSGKVFVVDTAKVALAELAGGIRMKELSIGSADIVANRLIKWYGTLELRAKTHHAVISNVSDALS